MSETAVRTRAPRIAIVSHACVVDVNQEPFLALSRRGVGVHVIAPSKLRTDIRGVVDFRALDGVDATPLPARIGGFRPVVRQAGVHLIVYRGLAAALKRLRPDLLYVEEEPWSFSALQVSRVAAALGVPFAFHQSQNLAKRLPPPFERIRRRVLRTAAGATARIGRPSEILRAQGFAGEILEIPNVIDPSRFEVPPAITDLPRPVFGFVGRLVAEKGILDFVASAPGSGSVVVAGSGPLEAEARALATKRGLNARFVGAVPHDRIGGVYASMDVVAVPSRATKSWTEQFGRVVIEANAAGVAVVVTDCGELPATVRATGGGVVTNDLAQTLGVLGSNEGERKRLGEKGRAAVRERFTPESVAAQLDEFFRRLEAGR